MLTLMVYCTVSPLAFADAEQLTSNQVPAQVLASVDLEQSRAAVIAAGLVETQSRAAYVNPSSGPAASAAK